MAMKKVLFIVLVIVFSLNISQKAQAQVFDKGTTLLDAGVGIPYYVHVGIPPVYGNFEMGVHKYFGIGVTGGFYSWGYDDYWYGTHYYDYERNLMGAGFGAFHFSELLKQLDLDMGDILNSLDFYYKMGFGMKLKMYNTLEWNPATKEYEEIAHTGISPIFMSDFGARFYFSDNLAVFMEVGYDFYSWTKFGITFKLK